MIDQFILFAALTFIASLLGTISGFGISTIMIPVMSLFYPIHLTLLFVAIIHLFGNVWKVIFFRKGVNWRLILGFGIPGIIASYAGASISLNAPDLFLKRLLGGFLFIYVFFLFKKQSWKIRKTGRAAFAGGSLSGFFAGIFGVGGAIRSAFLAAYDLPKEMYIYTSGVIALFIDISRIFRYFTGGTALPQPLFYILILLIPVSFSGAYVARKIVDLVPQRLFRLIITSLLGMVALKFLIFP